MSEHVVLVHGLLRSRIAMLRFESRLKATGFATHNRTWPLRTTSIRECGNQMNAVVKGLIAQQQAERVHFVGHSLGGLVIRAFLNTADAETKAKLGKAVLLGTPNNGSAVARRLQGRIAPIIPALRELASPECIQSFCGDSFPIPTMIVEGVTPVSVNPVSWLSRQWFGDLENDGVVSSREIYMSGPNIQMSRLRENHTFLPLNNEVIGKTVVFLRGE